MTKREHEELQKLFNQFTPVGNKRDYYFKELQDMSRELEMSVLCSAVTNYEQLLKVDKPYTKNGCQCTYADRARYCYEMYLTLNGKQDMLMELGRTLADLKFWKN